MYKQCKGYTKKGTRCRGGAMTGSDFCGPHTDYRPEGQTPPVQKSFAMNWDDPQCVKGYMDEMDRLDGE